MFNEKGDQTLSFGMIPILLISPGEMLFPDPDERPSERNRNISQLFLCCINIAKALHTMNTGREITLHNHYKNPAQCRTQQM